MRFLRLGLVLGLSFCSLSLAADREARDDGEINAIRGCLAAWGEHPFNSADEQPFRAISPSVKVLGVGQDVTDETVTDQPQLVLVKPSVNVLTKSNFRLVLFRSERHGSRGRRETANRDRARQGEPG